MIPAIGLMIAGYIAFRMFEVLLFAPNRYAGKTQQRLAVVGAVVVGVWVLICVADLLTASRSGAGAIP